MNFIFVYNCGLFLLRLCQWKQLTFKTDVQTQKKTMATQFYVSTLGGDGLTQVYTNIKKQCPSFDINLLLHHERPEQELLAKFLPKNSTVLEFGAGQGSTSIVIDKILKDPINHVVIDPSRTAVANTELHKKQTMSQFQIVHGFMAQNRDFQEQLWDECKSVQNVSLAFCKNLVGGRAFDVLVVDCEGAFLGVVRDFPELLTEATLILIEMDGDGNNCTQTMEILQRCGFTMAHSQCHPYYGASSWSDPRKAGLQSLNPKTWHNGIGFHQVWIKFSN
jgi:hypothetical protein